MRNGRLFIDNADARETYGIFVVEGGYDDIVKWPNMKEPSFVNWPEEDGIEPDLLSTYLQPKGSIRLDVFCTTAPVGSDAFIAMLQSQSYHVFNFKEIGITIPLRYKAVRSREAYGNFEKLTLEMAFDYSFLDDITPYEGTKVYLTFNSKKLVFNQNLLVFTAYDEGQGSTVVIRKKKTGLLLDSEDLGDRGILALEGTDEAITRPAPLKDNLIIKATGLKGQLYPDTIAVKDKRNVTIPLLLRAENPSLFWKAYLQLLDDLSSPGSHKLTWKGVEHKFYYQSQAITEFAKLGSNEIWCQFNLTVCFYEGD